MFSDELTNFDKVKFKKYKVIFKNAKSKSRESSRKNLKNYPKIILSVKLSESTLFTIIRAHVHLHAHVYVTGTLTKDLL